MHKQPSPKRALKAVPTPSRKITLIGVWDTRMLQYDGLLVRKRRLTLQDVRKAAREVGVCAHLRTEQDLIDLQEVLGVAVSTPEEEGRSRHLAFHDGDVCILFQKKNGRTHLYLLSIEVDTRPRDWFQHMLAS